MSGPEELRALVEEMRAALAFYADPDSYRNRPLDEQRELLGGDDPTISVRGDFAANAPPGCALSDIQMDRRGHRARTALTRAESSLASPAGMEGWMPIETAPKPSEWLRHASMKALVACITPSYEENDCEGEPSGPLKVRWAQVVTLCSSGWMVNTYGWAGINGHAEFRVDGATHWTPLSFPLPAAPRGEAK